MKKMYWQSHNLSNVLMILLCIIAIAGISAVEHFKLLVPQNYYQTKLEAAELAQKAMVAVKKARLKAGIAIDKKADPLQTGLIGRRESRSTSDHGVLSSKRAATNPNIAALIVEWMKEARLKKGDVIAIGMTGSFPGLDISTLAAAKTLGLRPILIVSGAASQWGANIPNFLFLRMLNVINKKNIIPFKPAAASLGGINDRAKNMKPEGIEAIKNTIDDLKIPFIYSPNTKAAIDKRMNIYENYIPGKKIRAYINVGGGTASIGKHHYGIKVNSDQEHAIRITNLKNGLNRTLPISLAHTDSVAIRFLKKGVPVINMKNMGDIAHKYHLSLVDIKRPIIGQGSLFFHEQYNIYLALIILAVLLIALLLISKAIKANTIARNQ